LAALEKLHKKTDTRSGMPPSEPADNGSTGPREIEDQAARACMSEHLQKAARSRP
jgi:hypothetical protein